MYNISRLIKSNRRQKRETKMETIDKNKIGLMFKNQNDLFSKMEMNQDLSISDTAELESIMDTFNNLIDIDLQNKLDEFEHNKIVKDIIEVDIPDILKDKELENLNLSANNIIKQLRLKYYNGSFYKPYRNKKNLYEVLEIDSDEWNEKVGVVLLDLKTEKHKETIIEKIKIFSKAEPFFPKKEEIVVLNGIYNYKTKILKPFNKDSFITKFIPYDYEDGVYDEKLDIFMNQLFPSKEVRQMVEEFLASVVIDRNQKIHKGLILIGEGGNGKSTLFKMIENFYGNNKISYLSISKLDKQFGLENLMGKWLNISDDTSIKPIQDAEIIKSLIGDGKIQIDIKYQKPINWKCDAKFLAASNKELTVSGESGLALKRRLSYIKMDQTFLKKGISDPFMLEKITTNKAMTYLLNLIIEGAKRILSNGFDLTEVQEVINYTNDSLDSHNNGKLFIKEEYDNLLRDNFVLADALYDHYKVWCTNEGISNAYVKTKSNLFKDIKNTKNMYRFRSKLFKTDNNPNPNVYIFKGNKPEVDVLCSDIEQEQYNKVMSEREKLEW